MTTRPPESDSEEMRPFAIHVEQIVYDISLSHARKRRVAVADLEFTKPMLEEHIKKLQNILSDSNISRGSIRVRFKGQMVLE